MNKVVRYFMMTVLAACFCVGAYSSVAEAASVALVPLINKVEGDDLANQVFYKSALAALNSKKGFVLVDNDTLTEVINASTTAGQLPTEEQLMKIAKEGNVDIVIAMQLDKLDDSVIDSSEERKLKLDLQGYTVGYNRIIDKAYKHRIYDDKVIPEDLTSRWDWTHEEWGRAVRVEIDKATREK